MIILFETIIMQNDAGAGENSVVKQQAIACFFKYLRGDPRTIQYYEPDPEILVSYGLSSLLDQGNAFVRELTTHFIAFLTRYIP